MDYSTVYVAKFGLDTNNGLSPLEPKLTIAAALIVAAALIAGGVPKCTIQILDSDIYTEDVTLADNMILLGESATLEGVLILNAGASASLDRHYATANGQTLVDTVDNAGETSFYSANIADGRGLAGTLINVDNFRNQSSGRVFIVDVGVAFVSEGGICLRDGTAGGGFGHIHFHLNDCYLAGNNAQCVRTNNATSNFIGFIDHILEFGAPTGTVGIDMRDAGAICKIILDEIIADEVWNITAGDLHIVCPKLTGTRTGLNPVILIDGIDTFSTSETLTTKTWLGNPVYRKVINCGALPNNATSLTAHNIVGFDPEKLTAIYGVALDSVQSLPLPWVNTVLSGNIVLFVNTIQVSITTNTDRTTYNGFVILEYTKV